MNRATQNIMIVQEDCLHSRLLDHKSVEVSNEYARVHGARVCLVVTLLAIMFHNKVLHKAEKQKGGGRRDSILNVLLPGSTWRSPLLL
jgi:hypothetical protein